MLLTTNKLPRREVGAEIQPVASRTRRHRLLVMNNRTPEGCKGIVTSARPSGARVAGVLPFNCDRGASTEGRPYRPIVLKRLRTFDRRAQVPDVIKRVGHSSYAIAVSLICRLGP